MSIQLRKTSCLLSRVSKRSSETSAQFWSAKKVAEAAVDEFGTLAQMVGQGNKSGAIDYLKRAPQRSSGPTAELGSAVHDLCDRIAKGEDIKRVHPEHEPFILQFKNFLRDFDVEFYESEVTVWSDTYGFAGTVDAICRIDDKPSSWITRLELQECGLM